MLGTLENTRKHNGLCLTLRNNTAGVGGGGGKGRGGEVKERGALKEFLALLPNGHRNASPGFPQW